MMLTKYVVCGALRSMVINKLQKWRGKIDKVNYLGISPRGIKRIRLDFEASLGVFNLDYRVK